MTGPLSSPPVLVQAVKDGSEDDLSDSDSDDDEDGAPVMHLRQIQQACGINRVRVMPQHSSTIATWGDDGRVQVGHIHLNASQARISLLASWSDPQRCMPS